jgi:hypothetical protein
MGKWIKPKRLARNLRRIARQLNGRGRGEIITTLNRTGLRLAESARRRLIEGRAPDGTPHRRRAGLTQWSGGGPKPGRDTGQLARSITSGGLKNRGRNLVLSWGSPLKYLKWYEEGGTVRPRSARLLAVPLTRRAKRYSSPRQYPEELILIKGSSGRLWLVQKPTNSRGAWEFVYALIPKAERPPRPVLPPSKRDVAAINADLVNALDREQTA